MNDTQVETLRTSSAQTAAGTETGTAVIYDAVFTKATFVLDVTVLATDADDTLDVYVDVSFDGGTTWINAVHFAQQLGNGSAAKLLAVLAHDPATDLHTITADLAAGNTRQIGLGTQMRYRGTLVDPTGSNASITWSLAAFLE